MKSFTEAQLERYSRNILLQDVGVEGQSKIMDSKVLVIGAGGLGSPVALYLAAAGVGTIGIADADEVELSNLQRQVIHYTQDVGKPKVLSAAEKIRQINPEVEVKQYHQRVEAKNIAALIADYDFIVDGTDNFSSKFLINDACVLGNKPFSHAGILRFDGQTITYVPKTACYRCLFPQLPPQGMIPTCSQAGIVGAVAGILGTIQVAEVIKYLAGITALLTNQLLVIDAKTMDFRKVRVKKDSQCPVCGDTPTITALKDEVQPVCDLKGV